MNQFFANETQIDKFRLNSRYYKYWVVLRAKRIVDPVWGKKICVL